MYSKLITLAAAMTFFSATACSNQEIDSQTVETGGSVTLNADFSQTKLAFDCPNVSWELTDQIAVFSDTETGTPALFVNVSEAPGATAKFRGNPTTEPYEKYYAIYPYQKESYLSAFMGEVINWYVFFDDQQTVPAEGFDTSHLIMTAEGTTTLHFKPRVGLLEVKVTDPDVTSIQVSTLDGENLAHETGVSWPSMSIDEMAGEALIVSERLNKITAKPAEGSFVIGKPYYIAMKPGSYKGICLTLCKGDSKGVKYSLNPIDVKAGHVIPMGEIGGLSYTTELPEGIFYYNDLTYYSGGRQDYPKYLPAKASFDIASSIIIYPESLSQELLFVSTNEHISVTPEGIATADTPTLGKVVVSSKVDPSVNCDVWLAFTGVEAEGFYWILRPEEKVATLTNSSYGGSSHEIRYSGNLTVPAEFTYDGQTYAAKTVGRCTFERCPDLISVTLPEGIETIEVYAFDENPNLESFNIPSTAVLDNISSNSLCFGCPKLTITSNNPYYPVDEYGNLYEGSDYDMLLWLCEKTTGDVTIHEGCRRFASGTIVYSTSATTLKFPASLEYTLYVNSFYGPWPNIETFIVEFDTYEKFEKFFKNFRKDSESSYHAGLFGRLRNGIDPIKLSVPAAYADQYATVVADYGFSELITY